MRNGSKRRFRLISSDRRRRRRRRKAEGDGKSGSTGRYRMCACVWMLNAATRAAMTTGGNSQRRRIAFLPNREPVTLSVKPSSVAGRAPVIFPPSRPSSCRPTSPQSADHPHPLADRLSGIRHACRPEKVRKALRSFHADRHSIPAHDSRPLIAPALLRERRRCWRFYIWLAISSLCSNLSTRCSDGRWSGKRSYCDFNTPPSRRR